MVARFVSTRPLSVAEVAEEAASVAAVATTLVAEVEGTAVVAMVRLSSVKHNLLLIPGTGGGGGYDQGRSGGGGSKQTPVMAIVAVDGMLTLSRLWRRSALL